MSRLSNSGGQSDSPTTRLRWRSRDRLASLDRSSSRLIRAAAILFFVLLPQPFVSIIERNCAALDIRGSNYSRYLEHVAGGDDQCGVLARLERADAVGHAQDLRRIERHALERLVGRKS